MEKSEQKESKYYTPEIEEFHVGFEYEVKDLYSKDDWEKKSQSELEPSSVSSGSGYCPFEYALDNKESISVRVKHLDKEDIESLGWSFKRTHILTEKYSVDWFEMGNKTIVIDYSTGELLIKCDQQIRPADRLFLGILKNKSELINQLKRCQIEILKTK